MSITYSSTDGENVKQFTEEITFKYMVDGNKFFIVESVSTTSNGAYDRVWILE